MKKAPLILNAVLLVAVIVLYILYFTNSSSNNGKSTETTSDTTGIDPNAPLKIASVNIDSLLRNYEYYKELETQMLEKQKKAESELQYKMTAFEKEAADFQKKVQANAFLSMESAQRQEQELYQKQQQLLQWKEEMSGKLMQETQMLESQLLDTVNAFLEDFNKTEKYHIIFNSASFLHGGTHLDITDTITQLLNKKYQDRKEK